MVICLVTTLVNIALVSFFDVGCLVTVLVSEFKLIYVGLNKCIFY